VKSQKIERKRQRRERGRGEFVEIVCVGLGEQKLEEESSEAREEDRLVWV